MKRSRFSEEQIIAILKEQENGLSTKDVCRRHGISSATFYKWKSKYGGLNVSDARKLKALEAENTALCLLGGRVQQCFLHRASHPAQCGSSPQLNSVCGSCV